MGVSTRTPLLAIAAMLLVAVSGCAQSTETAGRGTPTAREPAHRTGPARDAGSADGVPFNLYTHCGIRWAKIRGTFWYAEHEMSDGNGNPPEGWGNPIQSGRLSFQSRRTATFTSTAGQVIFHRTSQTEPAFMCS